jgi:3-oxoacyl-[acyl-carrier protein] reductase
MTSVSTAGGGDGWGDICEGTDRGQAVTGSLDGRVALITGASGKIGKAIARGLANCGVHVFLAYSRHADDAEEVAAQARALGRRAATAAADLSDPAAPSQLVEQAATTVGEVDILVANAGTATVKPWPDIDLERNATLAVNLTAPFLLAQKALPAMIDRGFGRVLFISSVAALNGGIVGAHYAASKPGCTA